MLLCDLLNNSIITAITHRFILGIHDRKKLYQEIMGGRFILGSTPLLIDNSIKQNTPCHANYQINSVIVGNINVAIRNRFILPINKNHAMMSDMIQKPNPYKYIGINSNGELEFMVNSKSSNMTYTIIVSVIYDDVLSSVPTYQIRHKDENECEGYKHRANCWHINDIQFDECCLCLTPLIVKAGKNGLFDQDSNKIHREIHINKNKITVFIHDYCLKALNELDDECDYI